MNYISSRWNAWWYQLRVFHNGTWIRADWLLNGPMFIDDQGICAPVSCTLDLDAVRQIKRPPPFAIGRHQVP